MTKTIITRKQDNIITNLVLTSSMVENGLLVNDGTMEFIIAGIENYNVYENVEIPTTADIEKTIYTASGGFQTNPNYKPVVDTATAIATLQAQNAQMLMALVEGGLI